MSQLKFYRKLGEVWQFDLTWLDATESPQSILGVADLAANWYALDDTTVVAGDAAGCTNNEVDADTVGFFHYDRTDLSQFTQGVAYKLEFVCTINGKLAKTPERGYIIVEVN